MYDYIAYDDVVVEENSSHLPVFRRVAGVDATPSAFVSSSQISPRQNRTY